MKTKVGFTRIIILSALLTAGISIMLSAGTNALEEPQYENMAGKEIFLLACANCHGPDGKGQPQSRVGFDVPLPDFTDCDFTSREPAPDFVSVAHQGGPVRGFEQLMPAFGNVLSIEEITRAVKYVKAFCTDSNWPDGELNLPRAIFTEKAYPEDEAVLTFGANEDFDNISGEFVYEQRFGSRNQIEIVIPFGWSEMTVPNGVKPATDWTSNLGDLAVGVKRTLFHSLDKGSIFSAAAEVIMPTGDEAQGFGKGTFVFEPFLSYGQILPADFFLHSQLGAEFPAQGDKAETEAFFRLALGRTFTTGGWWGRAWSPMIELLASGELESGSNIFWDIVPQIQVTLNTRQHIMFNIGVRIPGNFSSSRDIQVMAYLLWDWFDGGFLEGW
ncbi:MAG: c-type cytochrome [Candidatus Aminicenantes bacterium]|nr:c-type cytochrome [Candidatus Aminicenantes bacterium]